LKKGIAGKEPIVEEKAATPRRVSRSVDDLDLVAAESDRVSQRRVDRGRLSHVPPEHARLHGEILIERLVVLMDENLRTRRLRHFARPRDVIEVAMGVEEISNLQSFHPLQDLLRIVPGIDDHRFTLVVREDMAIALEGADDKPLMDHCPEIIARAHFPRRLFCSPDSLDTPPRGKATQYSSSWRGQPIASPNKIGIGREGNRLALQVLHEDANHHLGSEYLDVEAP